MGSCCLKVQEAPLCNWPFEDDHQPEPLPGEDPYRPSESLRESGLTSSDGAGDRKWRIRSLADWWSCYEIKRRRILDLIRWMDRWIGLDFPGSLVLLSGPFLYWMSLVSLAPSHGCFYGGINGFNLKTELSGCF